jgi:hypothetical protein
MTTTSSPLFRNLAFAAAGALAGALVATVGFREVMRRRAAEDEARHSQALAEVAAAEAEKRTALRRESAEREKEIEKARAAIESLRRQNAELQQVGPRGGPGAGAGPGAGGPQPKAKRKSWKELAARVMELRDLLRGRGRGEWPPEAGDLEQQLREAMTMLAAELGVSFDEAMASPGGLSTLLLELLAQSNPPPDAATMAKLQDVVAASEADWKAYLEGREGMSRLERRSALVGLTETGYGSLLDALSPDQAKAVAGLDLFGEAGRGGPQMWVDGNKETVSARLTENWSATLRLDAAQTEKLKPIVDEFVEKSARASYEMWKKEKAGEEVDRFAVQLELSLWMQKRLGESVPLSAEQEKAMREWGTVYGVNVADWEPEE